MKRAIVAPPALSPAALSELAGIARNPAAAYATRVDAARAIRKAGGMDGLGSGARELDLIAGKSAITEAQASQPFQVASRLLAAAETRDPAMRFRLLSAAVSMAPAANGRPRLQLFRSAVETQRWFLANSLIDEGGFDGDVELLRSVAEVKRRVGDPQASMLYQTKLAALLTGAPKAELERLMLAQTADAERRNRNEARRPVIGEAIVPDRVVRPRIAVGGMQQ